MAKALVVRRGAPLPAPAAVNELSISLDDATIDEGVALVVNFDLDRNGLPPVPVTFQFRIAQDIAAPAASGADFVATTNARLVAAIDAYNAAHPNDPPASYSSQGTGTAAVYSVVMPGTWDGHFEFTRGTVINSSLVADRNYGYELIGVTPGRIVDGVSFVPSKTVSVVIHCTFTAPGSGVIADVFLGATAATYATLADGALMGPYCLRSAAADTVLDNIVCKDTEGVTITPNGGIVITNTDGIARFKEVSGVLKVDATAPTFEGPLITNGAGYQHYYGIPYYQITITATHNAAAVSKTYRLFSIQPQVVAAAPIAPTTATPLTSDEFKNALNGGNDDVVIDGHLFRGVVEGGSGVPQVYVGNRRVIFGNPEMIMIRGGSPTLRGEDILVVNLAAGAGGGATGVGRPNRDGLSAQGVKRLIFRHVAVYWGIDGNNDFPAQGSIAPAKDVLIEYSINFCALRRAGHSVSEPVHAFGSLVNYNTHNLVWVNTIWLGNVARNPQMNGGNKATYVANCLLADYGSSGISMGGAFHGATGRFENNLVYAPATAFPFPVTTEAAHRNGLLATNLQFGPGDFFHSATGADGSHFIQFAAGVWAFADDPVIPTTHRTIYSTSPSGAQGLVDFKPFLHVGNPYGIVQMSSPAARSTKFWDLIDNCGPGLLVDPADYASARVSGRENAHRHVADALDHLIRNGKTPFMTGGYPSNWPDGSGNPYPYDSLDTTKTPVDMWTEAYMAEPPHTLPLGNIGL